MKKIKSGIRINQLDGIEEYVMPNGEKKITLKVGSGQFEQGYETESGKTRYDLISPNPLAK